MSGLLILGSGGHGKVVADIALITNQWEKIAFLDDREDVQKVMDIPVIGKIQDFQSLKKDYECAIVAVGNNSLRLELIEKLLKSRFNIPKLIHPFSYISKTSNIGLGTVIMAGTVINTRTSIGRGCIINTSSSIDHDCVINDGVHISPGVHIGGKVNIDKCTWVCINSSVINNVSIGRNVIVAAGAAVIKDITNNVLVAGIPAIVKKHLGGINMNNNKTIPLSVPNLSLDILDNIKETIETGWVSTGGRFIQEFEDKIAKYLGVVRSISCQSGTAGLHLALRVLGVEYGDEVIVPTLTFIAAVNPVRYMGAEPIFMDCDDNLNMDMDKLEEFLINECNQIDGKIINKRTNKVIKAIIAVHVFGNPLNMEKLMEIKEKYDLKLIEDATEALGSIYMEGKYVGRHCGTIGDIGVYSFNANKIITTGGGGMVVSNSQELLDRVAFLGVQAKTDPLYFIHDEVGYNYRMTNIQAAYGTDQIDRLESFIETKIRNYNLYDEEIKNIEGLSLLPFRPGTRSNHWFYSIIVDKQRYGIDRDELLKWLNHNNIQSRPLWGLIHNQKPYLNNQTYKIEKANFYEENLLNVPCSSNLTHEEVKSVMSLIHKNSLRYVAVSR